MRTVSVAVAFLAVAPCSAGRVTIEGHYVGPCASHIKFFDESGDQIGLVALDDMEITSKPGFCGASGDFTVTLPRRDVYEADIEGVDLPGFDVRSYRQLEEDGFEWNLFGI